MVSANGVIPTDKEYTGQRHSRDVGLYDYKARWFAAGTIPDGRHDHPDMKKEGASGGLNEEFYLPEHTVFPLSVATSLPDVVPDTAKERLTILIV